MYPIEPVKLEKNRAWRTYKGGKALSKWLGEEKCEDSHYPEEWVASTVTAINGKNNSNSTEGLCTFRTKNQELVTLVDFIKSNPEKILGKQHIEKFGQDTGVLVKVLDAAERLAIQVHPSVEKAKTLFNSPYGKTEAWYVLEGREVNGEKPHIFAGFKQGMTKEKLIELFEEQDIDGMLNHMNKIYVQPGEVYLVRGGIPHAIGAGCLIIEIQEATDYTIRIERVSPSGFKIEDHLVHQGLGFEKMFECFDWQCFDEEGILNSMRLIDQKFVDEGVKTLISYEDTSCFAMKKINVMDEKVVLSNENTFSVLIVTEGKGHISWQSKIIPLSKGDKVFLPIECDNIELEAEVNGLSILRCYPPKL